MSPQSQRRRLTVSWVFVVVMFALCGVLGFLQYRWVGEVSIAARDRLRAGLQASLERVSREFQTELTSAARSLAPDVEDADTKAVVAQASQRYSAWRTEARAKIFSKVGLALREGEAIVLYLPDAEARFVHAEWPEEWKGMHDFWLAMTRDPRAFRGGPGGFPPHAFEMPLFFLSGP